MGLAADNQRPNLMAEGNIGIKGSPSSPRSPKIKSPLTDKVTSGGFRFGFSFKGDKMFGSKVTVPPKDTLSKEGKRVAFGLSIGGDSNYHFDRLKKSADVKRSNTMPLPKTKGDQIREKYRGSSTLGRSASTRVPSGGRIVIEPRAGTSRDDDDISLEYEPPLRSNIEIEPKFPSNKKKQMKFMAGKRPKGDLTYDIVSFDDDKKEPELKSEKTKKPKKEKNEFGGFNFDI